MIRVLIRMKAFDRSWACLGSGSRVRCRAIWNTISQSRPDSSRGLSHASGETVDNHLSCSFDSGRGKLLDQDSDEEDSLQQELNVGRLLQQGSDSRERPFALIQEKGHS